MARRHYNLPPLTALVTFEAAARHLSFKDAARELNVTPGAVSHQIKALESELSLKLFDRRHRGVALSDHGALLFASLERSFADISATLTKLRRAGTDVSVTIAATTAVSSLWLTPRLTRFWKEHGRVSVNQQVSDLMPGPGEIVDLRIRYGKSDEPNKLQAKLFRDDLMPVCSPAFAEAQSDTSLAALAQLPLIHLDADDASWTTWQTWFREQGYTGEIAQGLRVNNFTIALQAAQDDAGVVLGWRKLARPLLERRLLVPLGPYVSRAPASFYIVSDRKAALGANVRILRDWILANR